MIRLGHGLGIAGVFRFIFFSIHRTREMLVSRNLPIMPSVHRSVGIRLQISFLRTIEKCFNFHWWSSKTATGPIEHRQDRREHQLSPSACLIRENFVGVCFEAKKRSNAKFRAKIDFNWKTLQHRQRNCPNPSFSQMNGKNKVEILDSNSMMPVGRWTLGHCKPMQSKGRKYNYLHLQACNCP